MKIWVDDIRTPPDDTSWLEGGWLWAKTSAEAIKVLDAQKRMVEYGGPIYSESLVTLMSLDHDLGGDDTTRPIVLWCCENNFWPVEVIVHSANPVGIEWLEGMIGKYKC